MPRNSYRQDLMASDASRGYYRTPKIGQEAASAGHTLDQLSLPRVPERSPSTRIPSESDGSRHPSYGVSEQDTKSEEHGLASQSEAGRDSAALNQSGKVARLGVIHHLKAWWLEVLCCFLALGLLAALVSILDHFDGKAAPEWPVNIPLSGLVAILTTSCRALTLLPVAEGLSQLKWIWFVGSKRRAVMDLYAFDQASRGPWGAFMLMFRLRGRFISLGTVAAAVIFSGLATSFLTQTAVYQDLRMVPIAGDDVEYNVTSAFTTKRYQWYALNFARFRDAGLQAVHTDALSDKRSTHVPQARCPTGNCEWPMFTSLAVCASVANVTEHLSFEEIEPPPSDYNMTAWSASLLEGRMQLRDSKLSESEPESSLDNWVMKANSTLNVTGLDGYNRSGLRPTLGEWDFDDRLTISQLFLIWRLPYVLGGLEDEFGSKISSMYQATEIMWHWCANSYNTTVVNGTIYEEAKMLNSTVHDDDDNRPISITQEEDDSSFRMWPDDPFGEVSEGNSSAYLRDFFLGAFDGLYILANSSGSDPTGMVDDIMPHWEGRVDECLDEACDSPSDFWRMFGNQAYGLRDTAEPSRNVEEVAENIEGIAGNIARALTTYMRSTAVMDDDQIRGTALVTKNVITIRWQWLSLLIAQIALTIGFLVSVMIYTARLGIETVKSSNIAELMALERNSDESRYPGAGEEEKPLMSGIRTKVDKTVGGTLVRNGRAWTLETY